MAKYNKDNNYVAFLMQLFGSIIFLFLAFYGATSSLQAFGSMGNIAGLVMQMLYAGAVISAVLLFLISLSYLTAIRFKYAKYAMCTTLVATFTLLAISPDKSTFYEAIVGFIISLAGAELAGGVK